MLDLQNVPDCTWNDEFEPIGCGGHNVESFQDWDLRVGYKLNNLCSEIREQWVHRHWTGSPLAFLPLETLTWREERWSPTKFISEVKTWRGDEALHPEFDFEVFANPHGKKLPTAEALDRGEWDYAPPVLCTPQGFIDTIGNHVQANYLLVEGHQRRRYLNALMARGVDLIDQRVFVMTSPLVD